jgi:hypothetical protein
MRQAVHRCKALSRAELTPAFGNGVGVARRCWACREEQAMHNQKHLPKPETRTLNPKPETLNQVLGVPRGAGDAQIRNTCLNPKPGP